MSLLRALSATFLRFRSEHTVSDTQRLQRQPPLSSVMDQSRASTEISLAIIDVDKVEQYHERHPNARYQTKNEDASVDKATA